jgi:two-component system sensor histidine kinase BaeS
VSDLSLAEVGALSLDLGPVDLAALIRELRENLEPVAADRGIGLEADVAAGLPVLSADGDRLRQVLVNLLANALQHTPAGGRVTVRARAGDGRVVVEVADTGAGIAPEDLPHLFERFYRADRARTRATGGTGLGLAIVRSLVQLHGGTVAVDSRPGAGSRFTVALPVR